MRPNRSMRRGDRGLALGRVGDVEAHGEDAIVVTEGAQRLHVAPGGHDRVPAREGRVGDRPPEAAAGSRDEPHPHGSHGSAPRPVT